MVFSGICKIELDTDKSWLVIQIGGIETFGFFFKPFCCNDGIISDFLKMQDETDV